MSSTFRPDGVPKRQFADTAAPMDAQPAFREPVPSAQELTPDTRPDGYMLPDNLSPAELAARLRQDQQQYGSVADTAGVLTDAETIVMAMDTCAQSYQADSSFDLDDTLSHLGITTRYGIRAAIIKAIESSI